jgi:hypothetical protein
MSLPQEGDALRSEPNAGALEGPPAPEFDQDAMCALTVAGLADDARAGIVIEARRLGEAGVSTRELGNWICRAVARAVGCAREFQAYDADGREIDARDLAKAQSVLASRAGRNRQRKRNEDFKPWIARAKKMVAGGAPVNDVVDACCRAIEAKAAIARGKQFVLVLPFFKDLPAIFGRVGKSAPGMRRLRERFLSALKP